MAPHEPGAGGLDGRQPSGPGEGVYAPFRIFHSKSVVCGGFVWAWRALNRQKWWFWARVVERDDPLMTIRVKLPSTKASKTPSWSRSWANFSLL
jgi:hypothetical protein